MRCAIDFDESKPLVGQEVKAWGEMQGLAEEPGYKESDIESETDRQYFIGYKAAMDDVCNILDMMVDDGYLKKKKSRKIQIYMSGELCMNLFSILDNQECEKEDSKN